MAHGRRPNILMIMADQLTPSALGAYGHPIVRSPNIDRLAAEGVTFESAYCNNPLCAPSRFTMLAGLHSSRIGAYDNASYFPSNQLTFVHVLRAAGYRTALAGKMHFIGADQTHGFEERLTTDIYPGDFGWVANWDQAEERIDWWYHNMSSVTEAGVAEVTNQLDFDDETGFHAVREIRDLARAEDGRPFFLCVSFTHPHDPYTTRQEFWDLYEGVDIDLPRVPEPERTLLDPHSRRLMEALDRDAATITEAEIKRARRAYYGNISYVDQWVGRIRQTLQACGLADDTIILFTGDHGDMLGERGLWYKMSFFENAARVPMIVHAPQHFGPRRVSQNVSLVDLAPTLMTLTDSAPEDFEPGFDGRDLTPLIAGDADEDEDTVFGEFFGEGAVAPLVMIRRGNYKYIACPADPPQLFDLSVDPDELTNLCGNPEVAETEAAFAAEVSERWDFEALQQAVLADQRNRRFIDKALRTGKFQPWDYQPKTEAHEQYMRNHLDLNEVEWHSRFPRPAK
ncbi:choline-sulfatase [Rhodobium orientis]|uniref:Choline-sulfatase n=1 Tax=Rhodobium orientis TaxID=34017 RepID=A0A327JQV7_9HYPH|nr:choline-sulfatase [Rhodobium orientis]MBB4301951.1 choline-sulfatase [Rhodobium orientis]MBK5950188.1 choline-sulfatase [Rhodobium orientis]RAI27252.1 choline-sulfatase [Rhodobium orientis]